MKDVLKQLLELDVDDIRRVISAAEIAIGDAEVVEVEEPDEEEEEEEEEEEGSDEAGPVTKPAKKPAIYNLSDRKLLPILEILRTHPEGISRPELLKASRSCQGSMHCAIQTMVRRGLATTKMVGNTMVVFPV